MVVRQLGAPRHRARDLLLCPIIPEGAVPCQAWRSIMETIPDHPWPEDPEVLAEILWAGGNRSVVELVDRLVEEALQAGGEDNITVALARVGSKGRQPGTNTGEAAIVAANSVRWPEPASRPVLGISPEPSRGGDRHA